MLKRYIGIVQRLIPEDDVEGKRKGEAWRQAGANIVKLAMGWLFSHPEEVQEEDKLVCALALSLGNSGSDSKGDNSNEAFADKGISGFFSGLIGDDGGAEVEEDGV
ncbi:hypothetical protein Droror1_Dr00012534, partial [Drosera rotundifolia]